MLQEIFIKISIFILCFAILDIFREGVTFYQCFVKLEKYEISKNRMFGLWAAISYIITIIFTGF